MWKKIVKYATVLIVSGILGYLICDRYGRHTETTPQESVIDSLEELRSSYESITDSLFLLKELNDSLGKAKIREVTKYKFIESVRYIETQLVLHDTIETVVSDSDSIAILRKPELQAISGKLAELDALQIQIKLDSQIIKTQAMNIEAADTLLILKDEVWKGEVKKTKRKFFGLGAGVGAVLVGLLWIL